MAQKEKVYRFFRKGIAFLREQYSVSLLPLLVLFLYRSEMSDNILFLIKLKSVSFLKQIVDVIGNAVLAVLHELQL